MLFGSWQLKTTVCLLFVASSVGQEQFRSCESDYCYERSIELRETDPNDSKEWHRYRNENIEREESTLLDKNQNQRNYINRRVNKNDERREGEKAREDQRLFLETRRRKSKVVQRQTISDVTRHLVNRMDERREFLTQLKVQIDISPSDVSNDQRYTLRQLSERANTRRERLDRYEGLSGLRENKRRSHDNREHQKLFGQLDERIIRANLENSQKERRENIAQMGKRYLSRSLNDAREYQRIEHQNYLERKATPLYIESDQEHILRNTLRRFDDREDHLDATRRSGVARDIEQLEEQHRIKNQMEEREDDNKGQGNINRLSEVDHDEHHDTLTRIDDFANSCSQRIDERHFRKERDTENRRNENKRDRNVSRRLEDSRKERRNTLSRFIDQRDLPRNFKSNREEDRYTLRRLYSREVADVSRHFDNDLESKNKWKRVEIIEASTGFDDRKTQHNILYREQNLRRLEDSKYELELGRRLENDRKQELALQRVEHNGEREDHRKTLRRMDYSQVQPNVSRTLANKDDLRRFGDLEILRGDNRLLRNTRNTNPIKKQLSQRNYELAQRDKERSDDSRESLHLVERNFLRERKIMQVRDTNEQQWEERHETSKRVDDHVFQNDLSRRLDVIRESKRGITQLSRRENESINRDYKNSPDSHQHLEISRRFENREAKIEDNRRLEGKTVELRSTLGRLDDREEQRDTSRRSENRRKEHDTTLRRLEHKIEFSELSEYTHSSGLIDEQREERVERHLERRDDHEAQYETRRHIEGTNRKALEMFKDHEFLRNRNRLSDIIREERHQIRRQLEQRKVSQRSNDERESQRLKGKILQKDRESIQHRNENERLQRYEALRSGDSPTYHKHTSDNFQFIEEGYTKKPTVFLRKGFMIFGQSAILAYVIIKTLNGKIDLKNQLPIKLREAVEIICF